MGTPQWLCTTPLSTMLSTLWSTTPQLFTGQWSTLPQFSLTQLQSMDTQDLMPHQSTPTSTVLLMSTLAPTLAKTRLVTATPPTASTVLPSLTAAPRWSPTTLPMPTLAMLLMSNTREWLLTPQPL